MFGYTIIKKSHLKELHRIEIKYTKVHSLYRWFSGWTDLDIIWDYIYQDSYTGGIREARLKYARSRNTDEYGKDTHDDQDDSIPQRDSQINNQFQSTIRRYLDQYTLRFIANRVKVSELTVFRWSLGKNSPHPFAMSGILKSLRELDEHSD